MTGPLARVPPGAHGWLRLVSGEIVEVTSASDGPGVHTTRYRHRAELGVATPAGIGRATTTDIGAEALRLALARAVIAVVPGRLSPPAPPVTAESREFADARPWSSTEVAEQVAALTALLVAGAGPDLRWVVRARTVRETVRRTDTAGMAVTEETTRAWLHARLATPAGAVTITGDAARHPGDLDIAAIAAAGLSALATGTPWSGPLHPEVVVWSPAATASLLALLTPPLLIPLAVPVGAPHAAGRLTAEHAHRLAAAEVTLIDDPWHRTGPLSSTFDSAGLPTARHLVIDEGHYLPPPGRPGPATNLLLARHGDHAPPGDCLRIDELHRAALAGPACDTLVTGFTGGGITGGRARPLQGLLTITVAELLRSVHGVTGPARFLLDLAGADAATLLTSPGGKLRITLR